MVKGFTKCLKIVKLFSITGIVCVCGYDIRDELWRVDFVQNIFLQPKNSNVEGKFLLCFVQIGHRERLSLWGKHPIDYRDTFLHLAWLEKLRKKIDPESVRHWIRPCASGLFTFFCHNGDCFDRSPLLGALQPRSMWHTARDHSFYCNVNIIAHAVDGSKQNKTLCVSFCVYAAIISALKKQWQKSYPLNFFSLFR